MALSPSTLGFLRAASNANRLMILEWLRDPPRHFPPQVEGDLVEDGVCLGAIVRKLGVSQPTGTNHMRILSDAGLVTSKKIGTWVFFRLREDGISSALSDLSRHLVGATQPTFSNRS